MNLSLPGKTIFVDFSLAQFGNGVNFAFAQFGARANFCLAQFSSEANFTSTQFGFGADFSFAYFDTFASFRWARLDDHASFRSAKFYKVARFVGTQFGKMSDFSNASFGYKSSFTLAQFDDFALFSETQFENDTDFISARFLGDVSFSHGSRDRDGEIKGSLIPISSNRVEQTSPAYCLTLNRQNDKVTDSAFRNIAFRHAVFWDTVDFSNRRFAEKCDFTDTVFYGEVKFHESVLHNGTKFTARDGYFFPGPGSIPRIDDTDLFELNTGNKKVVEDRRKQQTQALYNWIKKREFLADKKHVAKNKWRQRRTSSHTYQPVQTPKTDIWSKQCKDFEQSYRCLKILMQQMGARNEEQFFYTLEIKSRMQRLDVPRAEKAAAWLYGLVADYGQSVSKPLIWIGVAALNVFALFFLLSAFAGTPMLEAAGYDALYLVRNLVPWATIRDMAAGGAGTGYFQWLKAMQSGWVQFVFMPMVVLHGIVNLALWFLFALALRRRFQIS